MKRSITAALLTSQLCISAIALAQHAAPASARPALTPAKEASQFDFLVGQWELVVSPKVSSLAAKIHGAPQLVGVWKGWRALNGFGVEDELRVMDRSGNPSTLALGVRVYSASERKWLITSVDAYRGRISTATGQWMGAEMVTTSSHTDEEGKTIQTRTRYYDITANTFKYQQDRSTDGGRTWDEGTLKIVAKRLAATAVR